jgi:hypothetical protein
MPKLSNIKRQKKIDTNQIETDLKVNQYRTSDLIDRIVKLEIKVNKLENRSIWQILGFKK